MCSDKKYLAQPPIIVCPTVSGDVPNRPAAGAERASSRSEDTEQPTIEDCQVGFPIRTSRDQRVLSPPPGLSQSATSFIASCCQGIHQTPFSRLIRSRRRRALLRISSVLARFALLEDSRNHPLLWLWSEVDLTRWLAPSAGGGDLAIDAAFSVSVIDLERLFRLSCRFAA